MPPALLHALPRADELLRALCAYDVVGFHTRTYRQAFLECVSEMLGVRSDNDGRFVHRGRPVHAVVDPIGIDAEGFAEDAAHAALSIEARQLRESLPDGRALAIGADRLDYSKGLPNRFEAVARLLTHYPEHRRQVSLLQVAARSREDLGDYQRLRRDLDRIVGDINGRFSEFDWVPLRYMTRAVRRTSLAGFFRIARLGLVTPLRDGMNLVAKEYVAAQDPADPGVLILSRFAGAAEELARRADRQPVRSRRDRRGDACRPGDAAGRAAGTLGATCASASGTTRRRAIARCFWHTWPSRRPGRSHAGCVPPRSRWRACWHPARGARACPPNTSSRAASFRYAPWRCRPTPIRLATSSAAGSCR